MAFTKPRVTISFSDEQYNVLKQVSLLSGSPISKIISNLVELSLPMLQNQIKTLQRVQNEQQQHKQRITQIFESSTLNGVATSGKGGRK
ncbi:hypothetical protein [Nitrosomonas oligotropha]|nr:hypothetical protein [Nitrosomonas oligotropha]